MDEPGQLVGLAARDPRPLAAIYDAHANSVYGYALVLTRRRQDAQLALRDVFRELACLPERALEARTLRVYLLRRTRDAALRRRETTHAFPWRLAPAACVRGDARGTPPEHWEAGVLRRTERLDAQDLSALLGWSEEETKDVTERVPAKGLDWVSPPRRLRKQILIDATDAMFPWRPWLSLSIWLVVLAAVCWLAVGISLWAPDAYLTQVHRPPKSFSALQLEYKTFEPYYRLLEKIEVAGSATEEP